MPRRNTHQQTAPARDLTGLLLVARSEQKEKNPRDLDKLLDKGVADSIAKQADQPKAQL